MGDRDRFETDALEHLDVLYRAAWSLCRDSAEAEDLVQVTYLKALQKFESFEPRGSLKSWLLRILRNTWFDELRHRRVVGPTVSASEIPLAGRATEEDLVWSDANDLLENFSDPQVIRALKELPEHQRLALFLADVEQMPLDDVAEILGVAVGTVKSRTSRARAALKTRLQAHAEDLGLTGRSQ
jgi:RNA polymerase sigma-70 factor (ECF subfamily)